MEKKWRRRNGEEEMEKKKWRRRNGGEMEEKEEKGEGRRRRREEEKEEKEILAKVARIEKDYLPFISMSESTFTVVHILCLTLTFSLSLDNCGVCCFFWCLDCCFNIFSCYFSVQCMGSVANCFVISSSLFV
jgi:hypothetical protein